jgi:hypothetical protein
MLYDYELVKTYTSTLSREKAKELFLELSAFKNRQMLAIFGKYQPDLDKEDGGEPPEQFDQDVQMMEAQSADFIFTKYGIEVADLRVEVLHHGIEKD